MVVVLPKTQCAKAQIPLRIFPAGTQIMKVGDVICVADFHDLCLRQMSRTLLQSRRNGIWAYPNH